MMLLHHNFDCLTQSEIFSKSGYLVFVELSFQSMILFDNAFLCSGRYLMLNV